MAPCQALAPPVRLGVIALSLALLPLTDGLVGGQTLHAACAPSPHAARVHGAFALALGPERQQRRQRQRRQPIGDFASDSGGWGEVSPGASPQSDFFAAPPVAFVAPGSGAANEGGGGGGGGSSSSRGGGQTEDYTVPKGKFFGVSTPAASAVPPAPVAAPPADKGEADDELPKGKFFGATGAAAAPPATPATGEGEGEGPGPGSGLTEGYWAPLMERPDRLRASDLNELLMPGHLDRLRFANSPLMAYGALFKWEVLTDGVAELCRRPWETVAAAHGLEPPSDDALMRAAAMRPDIAVERAFRWTSDRGLAQQYAFEHYEARRETFERAEFGAREGAAEWLALLQEYGVPCSLCALSLPRTLAEVFVERTGLKGYFDEMVVAEDVCETPAQAFLVSCVKLRRPPSRCVVFTDEPRGVVAAHESTAKAVGVVSERVRGGDLILADLRISGLDELNLYSLRTLFKGEEAR